MKNLPALAICGFSGSGKTTLIEALLPRLRAMKLDVAVVKHDTHGLDIDRQGKDSDRLFRAGAEVFMQGPGETFWRSRRAAATDLATVLRLMVPRYDLILLEGSKATPALTKIWLLRDGETAPPPEVEGIVLVLDRNADRVGRVAAMLESWLPEVWLRTPVYAGILIGGRATRMGTPKHLLRRGAETWLEHTAGILRPFVSQVVLLGGGEVPCALHGLCVLPDVEGRSGPVAGMLAAMRWNPAASWLFAACDLPLLSGPAVAWLLATRRPGVWATMPARRDAEGAEPLFAHYDFRAAPLLENARAPRELAASDKVFTPEPPPALAEAWRNVNTREELRSLEQAGTRKSDR